MSDRLFRDCLFFLCLSALALTWISRYTAIDLLLSDWMYDPVRQQFPWRENWFAAVFMHYWVKDAFIGAGLLILGLLAAAVAFRLRRFDQRARARLSVVAASAITVPLAVSLLKSQSIHHCPWDLQRYGGSALYLRLFDKLPAGAVAGHCFPAGHASSALWLAAFAVFWLPERPRMAAIVFALGLVPGLLMGWMQQMRGAHFLSHTLWSAWIASLVFVLTARLLYPHR
jgi:membrane-associated PAP2 superfamily phosphatase